MWGRQNWLYEVGVVLVYYFEHEKGSRDLLLALNIKEKSDWALKW